MLKLAVVFGVAVFAGLVGTRMRPVGSSAGFTIEAPAKTPDRAKSWKSDNFLGWIRENEPGRGYSLTPNPVSEELKAWSDEELRVALDGALADASTALPNGRATTVIGWLIQEWMSRDPDAVVAWFEGLGSESKKRRLASWLGAEAREKAIRGLVSYEGASTQSLVLMQQLPTDDDRVNFAAASLRGFSLDTATPLLEALPSQALQAEALGRWVQGLNAVYRNSATGTLDQMMERLKFPDDQREVLRAKLPQAQ